MRWTVGRKVLGSLGALALAAASVYAVEGPGGEGHAGFRHGGRGWGGPMRMVRALNLTEEQRAQFKQLAEEHHKAQQPLREQAQALHQQLRQNLESGTPDAAAVGQLAIQAHAVEKQLHESRAQLMERFEGLLTPEQKAKLEELKSQRGQRGFDRSGPRRQKRTAPDAPGAQL
ncbi:MAG TPA: Spy/CpxP family protein refolding chaperone [Vicinamibacteria bacterium]